MLFRSKVIVGTDTHTQPNCSTWTSKWSVMNEWCYILRILFDCLFSAWFGLATMRCTRINPRLTLTLAMLVHWLWQIFCEVAYKAKTAEDLISGIDEYMEGLTVLPSSVWDPQTRLEPPTKSMTMVSNYLVHYLRRLWITISHFFTQIFEQESKVVSCHCSAQRNVGLGSTEL